MKKLVVGHDRAAKKLIDNLCIQSWLVCGKRGIGKVTLIESFSNWFLIKNQNKIALDLYVVQDDVIGVEKVKEMKSFLYLSPIQSEYKIAVIDSLEEMTDNAKNAILKILEEPPKNSKIFIISHNPYNIQLTIKYRCFQLNLAPLTYDQTKQVVFSQCKFDYSDKVFDEIFTIFPGMPGMILSAINSSSIYTLYKSFYLLFSDLGDLRAINKILDSEIKLELALYIIQSLILNRVRIELVDRIEILLNKWRKIEKLFFSAKKFHLDRKQVLANVINVITSDSSHLI